MFSVKRETAIKSNQYLDIRCSCSWYVLRQLLLNP